MTCIEYKNPCCRDEPIQDIACPDCNMADKECGICKGTGYKLGVSACSGCGGEFPDHDLEIIGVS